MMKMEITRPLTYNTLCNRVRGFVSNALCMSLGHRPRLGIVFLGWEALPGIRSLHGIPPSLAHGRILSCKKNAAFVYARLTSLEFPPLHIGQLRFVLRAFLIFL